MQGVKELLLQLRSSMTSDAHFPKENAKEAHPYLASILALFLIVLCLIASNWQYQRGVERHARNALISSHIALAPTTLSAISKNLEKSEWQSVNVEGSFDSSSEILLRNRYHDGKYGFHLLSLFREASGKNFWVNRGWVQAGKNASTPPDIMKISNGPVSITARVRLDRSLPQGSFFALSRTQDSQLIRKWNAQGKNEIESESFYLDLLSSSDEKINPAVVAELPELTDGPHMAYALQWFFFAGLVIYGRVLLRRAR